MKEPARSSFNRREIPESEWIPTSKHISYDMVIPGTGVITPEDYIDEISDTGVVGTPL
jgi:hypothetical protein